MAENVNITKAEPRVIRKVLSDLLLESSIHRLVVPGVEFVIVKAMFKNFSDIKVASSIWMKESDKFPLFEGWQDGYGAFTYSIREKDMIVNYIRKQKEHHHKENFYDEYKRLLEENGIEFDEKYLL